MHRGAYGVKKLIFLFLFLCTPISAKESVTLGILVFPPHSRIDELTNECVGAFITITEKILAEYAINVDAVCAPPIRIYRMLENADVDFTINIKSTTALPKDIVFVDIPFSTLNLDLYSHKNAQSIKSVAAIRGFSYDGFRTKLLAQGYEFFDLPTSISAIQLFLKKRTNHLISYRAPVDYYIQEKKLNIKDSISILPLIDVPTYYGISSKSPHLEKLKAALDDYATKYQLTFFDQVNLSSE
jgi:polar amino acid transport system substrate-binding protein